MASSSSSEPELRTEQEILARFQDMRQKISAGLNQLSALDAETAEHDLVIKQLEPMDKSRKCYRLIGDVLVERTVAETLPAVKRNRDGLEAVMKQMQSDLQAQQKALAAFTAKYKIRAVAPGEEEAGEGGSKGSKPGSKASSGAGGGSSSKGVLA